MSFKAMQWALEQEDVFGNDKWVLFVLAYRDNHDEPHGCFPSFSRISKDCGIARSTVALAVDRLVAKKKIKREKRKTARGANSYNYYSFPEVYRPSDQPNGGIVRQSVRGSPTIGKRVVRPSDSNLKRLTVREPSRSAQSLPPDEQKKYQDNFLAEMKRIAGTKTC